MVYEPPQPPDPTNPSAPSGPSGSSGTDQWGRPLAPPPPGAPGAGFAVADLQPASPPPRRRRWPLITGLAVVVAAAVAIPIAVSSGGKNSKTPLQVLSAASGQTTASGSAKVSSVETITGAGRTFQVLQISGATDWAHKLSSMSMSARGRTVMEIRQVDGVTYMSSPAASLPGGAHWVAIRPSDLPGDVGSATLGTNDPSNGLKFLSAVNGNPKVAGTEVIDGVQTTHYTFTLDIRKSLEQAAKAAQALGGSAAASPLSDASGMLELSKLPGEAWIDGQGRVRRFQFTIEQSADGQTIKVVDVMNFTDFDAPVTVAKPSASDVAPFSEFTKLIQGMTAGLTQSAS